MSGIGGLRGEVATRHPVPSPLLLRANNLFEGIDKSHLLRKQVLVNGENE